MNNQKLKIGVFGISGCAGCLLTILFEPVFKEIVKLVDIKSFPLIKEDSYAGNFDYCFIEGTVCFDKDVKLIKELRKKSKYIVALGACSHVGGVPSIKNFLDKEKAMKFVYPKYNHLKSTDPVPINKHIKVDYYIPQCPPDKKEILEFFKSIALGKNPQTARKIDPVCFECRKKGNECLLEKGELCLGPITLGGCNALCPTNNVSCYGCRGPTEDLNLKAFLKLLIDMGFSKKDFHEKVRSFAGLQFFEKEKEVSKWLEK
ncbi:MAG: NADH:ubiquinone oxidoreductase [Candidatus Pacearchaeota archaeon]|jgi:sulfhydrogenase subunit delta